ncbi:MAG: sigma-70 family RNA polymerase sigma factor [Opitutaceae bacterium]
MPTDQELLQRFVAEHAEDAFATLVERYVDLVYGAAHRRTGGRHGLAQEIAQEVFIQLARKAAGLATHPTLAGWLHRSTRYATIDALRAETRRRKLAESVHAMSLASLPPEPPADWERLSPLIDEALDTLKGRDRELMLLRFFRGLSFREIGTRLGLSENAARMRTERALDTLRLHLGRHGITSTSAALGLLLANQPALAAPAGLAAQLTTVAATAAPAGMAASLTAFPLMSKFTAPALAALAAAGLTALVWTSAVRGISGEELTALRAENARLTAATATGATAALADEFAAQAVEIARAVDKRLAHSKSSAATAARPATPNGHSDHGQATAREAMLSFAWAADAGEVKALARLVWFDGAGREKAVAIHDALPDAIRAEYATPEEFYALLLVADALLHPPPTAEYLERCSVVEAGPGRVSLVRPSQQPDRFHQYQQTADGWKFVVPEFVVGLMPQMLNAETLAALNGP